MESVAEYYSTFQDDLNIAMTFFLIETADILTSKCSIESSYTVFLTQACNGT